MDQTLVTSWRITAWPCAGSTFDPVTFADRTYASRQGSDSSVLSEVGLGACEANHPLHVPDSSAQTRQVTPEEVALGGLHPLLASVRGLQPQPAREWSSSGVKRASGMPTDPSARVFTGKHYPRCALDACSSMAV